MDFNTFISHLGYIAVTFLGGVAFGAVFKDYLFSFFGLTSSKN
jgi:hypothetical protein